MSMTAEKSSHYQHLPNGRSGSPSPKHLPLTSNAGSTTTNTYLVEPPLNKYSAEAFSDILGIEWGLSKLLLEGGIIDHDDVGIPTSNPSASYPDSFLS
jgi:hypothetical protein